MEIRKGATSDQNVEEEEQKESDKGGGEEAVDVGGRLQDDDEGGGDGWGGGQGGDGWGDFNVEEDEDPEVDLDEPSQTIQRTTESDQKGGKKD